MIYLPLPPMAKARPRVTKRGTYMPKDYQAWRVQFAFLWRWHAGSKAVPHEGRCRVDVIWSTKTGNMRPDCDNAYAAVMDALQDSGAFVNDRQVKTGFFDLVKATKEQPAGHYITITPTEATK